MCRIFSSAAAACSGASRPSHTWSITATTAATMPM
jgi:hypothetical protein